jgi:hypothetical protein
MSNRLRGLLFVFLGGLALAGSWLLDPINRLDARLSVHPLWVNGLWGIVPLGQAASPQDVLDETMRPPYSRKPVPPAEIRETKTIHLWGETYTAVLFKDGKDWKIMLMDYEKQQARWETRSYAVDK